MILGNIEHSTLSFQHRKTEIRAALAAEEGPARAY